jgi:hypothetical protein
VTIAGRRRADWERGSSETLAIFGTSALKAPDKFQLGKNQIADNMPSDNLFIAAKELEILRRWLAARCRRHAFPDAFEDRLNRVEDQLREILKKSTNHLRAILFDLDEGGGLDPTPQDPYNLDIYLLYTTDPNPNESLKVAQGVKAKVEKAFHDKYKDTGQWKEIELRSCEVISDQALKYSQYLQLREWRSEDLSLRSEPSGPMTEENS